MTELDKLPYLDSVVRETLRVYPAVPNIGREVAADAVIPVGESFKDRNGVSQMEIR
jgi:cytochrome P450